MDDTRPDTSIPPERIALGLEQIAQLRAQLAGRAPEPETHAPEDELNRALDHLQPTAGRVL